MQRSAKKLEMIVSEFRDNNPNILGNSALNCKLTILHLISSGHNYLSISGYNILYGNPLSVYSY